MQLGQHTFELRCNRKQFSKIGKNPHTLNSPRSNPSPPAKSTTLSHIPLTIFPLLPSTPLISLNSLSTFSFSSLLTGFTVPPLKPSSRAVTSAFSAASVATAVRRSDVESVASRDERVQRRVLASTVREVVSARRAAVSVSMATRSSGVEDERGDWIAW